MSGSLRNEDKVRYSVRVLKWYSLELNPSTLGISVHLANEPFSLVLRDTLSFWIVVSTKAASPEVSTLWCFFRAHDTYVSGFVGFVLECPHRGYTESCPLEFFKLLIILRDLPAGKFVFFQAALAAVAGPQ